MSARKERREAERFKYPKEAARTGRFSSGYHTGRTRIRQAEIYDISHKGISFRIEENYAPEIGELIAVEFKLPNAEQMAWYAKVSRVELEYIESSQDEFTKVLRIGAVFIDLPELRQRQLQKLVDQLVDHVQGVNVVDKISALTNALRVRRRHEVTAWKYVRAGLIFAVSMFLAYEFISYMTTIGNRYMRGSGPAIWQHRDYLPFQDTTPKE